jgi:hypothetical protein
MLKKAKRSPGGEKNPADQNMRPSSAGQFQVSSFPAKKRWTIANPKTIAMHIAPEFPIVGTFRRRDFQSLEMPVTGCAADSRCARAAKFLMLKVLMGNRHRGEQAV